MQADRWDMTDVFGRYWHGIATDRGKGIQQFPSVWQEKPRIYLSRLSKRHSPNDHGLALRRDHVENPLVTSDRLWHRVKTAAFTSTGPKTEFWARTFTNHQNFDAGGDIPRFNYVTSTPS
jgi:hypothetical protein